MIKITEIFNEHKQVIDTLDALCPKIIKIADQACTSIKNGGKVFWMGNGGSAADAQHLAAELIGRFKHERRALPSIALNTDTSVLTCLSNDYDYSIVFARQLEALCGAQDLVIGISTSGNSKNILLGLEEAKRKGAFTVALTGNDGGLMATVADESLVVASKNTARIQEAHILIGHTLCQIIEEYFFQNKY